LRVKSCTHADVAGRHSRHSSRRKSNDLLHDLAIAHPA
jgi:hypothetical protein